MNKHHEELVIQFQSLFSIQNQLKQSFAVVESTWTNKTNFPCLIEIDHWEQDVIDRVRQIAANARITANEMMAKNISDIRHRFDQLAFEMEQRQQEGNYLDNDIISAKSQLEQLNNAIKHVNGTVRINCKKTNKVKWRSLMYVVTKKQLGENLGSLSDFHYGEESPQQKIWNNLKKLVRNTYTNNDYRNTQSGFQRHASTLFEPVVLTSFGSPIYPLSQENIDADSESIISDNSQPEPFSNDDLFNHITFKTNDDDEQFSHV